jgi:hypothetical protein
MFASRELTKQYHRLLGMLTHVWAGIELGLDAYIGLIYYRLGGIPTVSRKLPRTFERKIAYLRDAFDKLTPLARYKQDGLSILDKIEALGLDRHMLIHGVAIQAIDAEMRVELTKFVPNAYVAETVNKSLGLEDVEALVVRGVSVGREWTNLMGRTRRELFADEPD